MRELSLHILDIAQNSVRANATLVQIKTIVSTGENSLVIEIEDNGSGMSKELTTKIFDPFVTTRTTRKVGLGIPLFKAAAEQCEGDLTIESVEGRGTLVKAWFHLNHIDRAPLGDMVATLVTLIQGNPNMDFIYQHKFDDQSYEFSTQLIRQELGEVPINHPLVLEFISKELGEGLINLTAGV